MSNNCTYMWHTCKYLQICIFQENSTDICDIYISVKVQLSFMDNSHICADVKLVQYRAPTSLREQTWNYVCSRRLTLQQNYKGHENALISIVYEYRTTSSWSIYLLKYIFHHGREDSDLKRLSEKRRVQKHALRAVQIEFVKQLC